MTTLGTARVDLREGATRWDGRYRRLIWTGYRGPFLRSAKVKLTIRRLRFMQIALSFDWHSGETP